MVFERASGILLHPSSLPDTPGIGTIGQQAFRFVDWLVTSNQSLWQILPLGPTGYGDSPYASFSTFAGNPLLIDLDLLKEKGLLTVEQATPPDYIRDNGSVDFGSVVWWKIPLLKKAAEHFLSSLDSTASQAYEAFKNKQISWLDNYAVFMSIKEFYDAQAQAEKVPGAMWNNYWPRDLATHKTSAIDNWVINHSHDIEVFKAIQFFFFSQWDDLKRYAHEKGISIIGDIPIFVAPDSADVWANQHLFQVDKNGVPLVVAGVPPDYFSATGQLWGNPLYNWEEMKKNGYSWWKERIRMMLEMVDFIRIDHFRGFEAYWAVPYGEKTAENGAWLPGPDHDFFNAIKDTFGSIPILAEDLGLITDRVKKLRDDYTLPGMKVLQFAFDIHEAGKDGFINPFLPHMYTDNCVVYTGTHDNETMQGWINAASEAEIDMICEYLGNFPRNGNIVQELIRVSMASVARFAIFPMQDIFSVGSEGRMNTPSTTGGQNWQWRMSPDMFSEKAAHWLKNYSRLYGRNLNNHCK